MRKKVSVAIPTYNRIPYLKECIQSVLNQTFQDFSIFVFDNASEEPVKAELKKFKELRIYFVGNDKNIGAEGNLNRILEYPFESEYLIIFHDDDTMHPKLLEAEVALLDAHPEAVFAVSDLQRVVKGHMQNFASIDLKALKPVFYKNNEFVKAQMSWLRYGFPSAMYRVGIIGNTRMRPEFFHFLDMVFLAEMAQKGVCLFLPAPLMNHRIHAEQYSEIKKGEYEIGISRFIQFLREQLPERLDKADEKLFRKYSMNVLLRASAHINSTFYHSVNFLKDCRKKGLISYADLRYIDARGIVSVLSILFGSRKIIDAARRLRNALQIL